ncbi:MAG: right-handed parallel beta-helix repeat-containing protein [Bifidobacteriaceae bacterium]|jgi:hypothetical protein|nr:right-handed parallel beta-helix repeat-containing protein [Bifidobacteriaceae bacterium]
MEATQSFNHLNTRRVAVAAVLALAIGLGLASGPMGGQTASAATVVTYQVNTADYNPTGASSSCSSPAANGEVCSLRKAIELGNAAGDGVEVRIEVANNITDAWVTAPTAELSWMTTSPPTGVDIGAYYHIKRTMTIDLGNRLHVQAGNTLSGTAFWVDAPGVQLLNFTNVFSGATAIVFSPKSDGSVLEGGSSIQKANNRCKRFALIMAGADNVTIRNYKIGRIDKETASYDGAISISKISWQSEKVINNLTISGVTIDDTPDGSSTACSDSGAGGCATRGITFSQGIIVNGLTIQDTYFVNSGKQAIHVYNSDLTGVALDNVHFIGTKDDAWYAYSSPISGLTVKNSEFADLAGDALSLYGSSVSGLVMRCNTFSNLKASGIHPRGSSVVTAPTIRHNAFSGVAGAAVLMDGIATVSNLDFRHNRFTAMPGNAFATSSIYAHLKDSSIHDNKFSDFASNVFRFENADISSLSILDNEFTNIHAGLGAANATILLPTNDSIAGKNTINGNTFDNSGNVATGARQGYALYWDSDETASSTTASNLFVEGNEFNGYAVATIALRQAGLATVRGNIFGVATESRYPNTAEEETQATTVMFNNDDSNRNIPTWYPTAAAWSAECELTVTLASTTKPATPVTIDFYWTSLRTAEKYLGSVTGLSAAGTFTVPEEPPADGYLRVQTHGRDNTSQPESSQYSRTITNPDRGACEPKMAVALRAWVDVPAGATDYNTIVESGAHELEDPAHLVSGAAVWFTYGVENTGRVPLTDVVVHDSHHAPVCVIDLIPAGQTRGCARAATVP